MNYNIERYNELKKIIEKKEFFKIGEFRDYPIIRNSDLKYLLLDVYMRTSNFKNESNMQDFVNLLREFFDNNELFGNKKFLIKYMEDCINLGNIPEDEELDDLRFTQIEKENFLALLMKNIKNPNYQIQYLPGQLKKNEEFIDYCFENNNVSILNFIDYKKEYFDKAENIIKKGYGVELKKSAHGTYRKNFSKLLVENGYLSNFQFLDSLEREQSIPALKKHISNGKKFIFPMFVEVDSKICTKEFINLMIDNNQYNFMSLFHGIQLTPYVEKIIKKIKEGYKFEENIRVENPRILKALVEANQLNFINCFNETMLEENLELFKEKLKEGVFYSLNPRSLVFKKATEDMELLNLLIKNNLENLLIMMNHINHNENLMNIYNNEFYQTVKVPLAKEYNLNLEHLDYFVNRFGPKYLYYLENANIKNAINLEEESLKKYMNLFSYDNLNLTNAQNIYDSILQARFATEHKVDITRLTRIKSSLENQISQPPIEDLTILANSIDITEIKKHNLLSKLELEKIQQQPLIYLIEIYNQIQNKENIDKNLTIIYEINRQYLRKKREEYRKNNHYEAEIKLKHTSDINSVVNVLISDLIKSLTNESKIISIPELYELIKKYQFENLNSLSNPTKENVEKLKGCLLFLNSNGKDNNTRETKENIKLLKEILKKLLKNKEIFSNIEIMLQWNDCEVKKNPSLFPNDFQIFSILQEIDPFELEKTVFNNQDIYIDLVSLLAKYKFPEWQDTFKDALEKSHLSLESYDIATLISKFNEFYKYKKEKMTKKENINLPEIIKYANTLSSASNRYSILLEKENSKLIQLNPIPNAATINGDKDSRLKIAVENLIELYNRKEITVPPINEDILINNKRLNINLGNFTNPINLTYGERTGACMRIMGLGESLYNFCRNNVNGFHIRLTDVDTEKFISRVSGFRNGNSVFLNELRYSVDKSLYSNEEVVIAIKKIAKMIIEKSQSSTLPIVNVFITNQYAMEFDESNQMVKINEDIKKDLPPFYFDLREKGILLETTAKENQYVPINTDKAMLPKYKVIRDKIKAYQNVDEIFFRLNRYYLLQQMITNKNPEIYQQCGLIPVDKAENIIYLLCGEDWIAYLDKDLKITSSYIERNDDRVKNELNTAKEILKKKKEELEINETTSRSNYRI